VRVTAGWAIAWFLVGALTVGLYGYGQREREMGRWIAERTMLEQRLSARQDTVRVTDSVFAVDSSAFRSYATRYYRLRDSLRNVRAVGDNHPPVVSDSDTHVPDSGTLNKDSALVRLRPETLLAVCDSTVRIAEQALASCAARVRAGDSLLAATRERLAHEQRKPGPRRFPALVVGPQLSTDGKVRLGVTLGVRLW